jgi:hypothetical protein
MWSGVKVWEVKGLILKGHIEWPICKILHAFPYKMEVQMSFLHMTWKDIDWLKWLNGKMVTKMAKGKLLMHFLITSRGKCISSYDMKRHWSIELNKWEGGQWEIFLRNKNANAFFHVTWRGTDWLSYLSERMANGKLSYAFFHDIKMQMNFFMWYEISIWWKNTIQVSVCMMKR